MEITHKTQKQDSKKSHLGEFHMLKLHKKNNLQSREKGVKGKKLITIIIIKGTQSTYSQLQ